MTTPKKTTKVKAPSKDLVKVSTATFPKTRADVPAAIASLKARLDEALSNIDEKLSIDINYENTNIKNVTTLSELIEIGSAIDERSAAFARQAEKLGLTDKVKEFQHSGKTAAQWNSIIAKAAFELENSERVKKLRNAIKKLETHLDEETRLQNDLAEIMDDATKPLD